jgi:cystathionine beta-lyase/cystathionine gamma-synthase
VGASPKRGQSNLVMLVGMAHGDTDELRALFLKHFAVISILPSRADLCRRLCSSTERTRTCRSSRGATSTRTKWSMVVDNTVATALLQRPLELGAIASLYSLTKALSGHSDVLLGAVVTRDRDLLCELREWRTTGGGIPGSLESWLALRGMRTLHLRIMRQSENALAIARYLAGHPRVSAVHYPGVTAATLDVAAAQMTGGFGPLLSFELAGDSAAEADAVIAAAQLIVPATSFGGVESTWERRARWPAETAPASLIRLSAGIEPAADLIADVALALSA